MSSTYDNIPGAAGCEFADLQPDEDLLMVVRRHWIVLVIVASFFLLFAVISLALYLLIPFTNITPAIVYLLIIVNWFFGAQFLFIKWLDYELDFFLVTDKRIIGYDQVGFLNRKTVQASIDQVQEIFAVHKGILPSLLHYGELHIQTASETTELVLPMVDEALEVSRTIHNFIDTHRLVRGPMKQEQNAPTPKERINQLLQ